MNLRCLLVLTLLATAGCEKTSDLVAMQDEANAIALSSKPSLDALKARVTMLENRGKTLTADSPGIADARKLFVDTNSKLVELNAVVQAAPTKIKEAAVLEHPRAELIKVMGDLRERLDRGQLEVTTNLNAVESWLTSMEWRPRLAAGSPPATTPPPAMPHGESPH